jgi:uncharacterized UBP type Zn finger protein
MKKRKLPNSKDFINQSASIQNFNHNYFSSISVQDTLNLFFQDEILKDFKCENCKNSGEAIIKRKFNILPRILILHLKRYQFQLINQNLNKSNYNEYPDNFRLYKNDSTVKISKFLNLKFLTDYKTKEYIPKVISDNFESKTEIFKDLNG